MQANLAKSLGLIFVSEGGFAIRSTEPGGAVNMGISMATYAAWRAPKRVTIADLQAMTIGEATEIYTAIYAGHIDFDQMPSGVDYCSLDAAVNEGIGAELIFLSLALNYPPYPLMPSPPTFEVALANIGKINFTALKALLIPSLAHANLTAVINWICDNRIIEKRKRDEWAKWGPGWTKRIERVRSDSMEMLGT
jgi:lysozyme family protein